MKVIAIKGNGNYSSNISYIVEVSHTEIEKVMGKYYNNLNVLKEGSCLDLGEGYDFTEKIQECCKQVIEANKTFSKNSDSLIRLAEITSKLNCSTSQN